jgi:hypothetical protein
MFLFILLFCFAFILFYFVFYVFMFLFILLFCFAFILFYWLHFMYFTFFLKFILLVFLFYFVGMCIFFISLPSNSEISNFDLLFVPLSSIETNTFATFLFSKGAYYLLNSSKFVLQKQATTTNIRQFQPKVNH